MDCLANIFTDEKNISKILTKTLDNFDGEYYNNIDIKQISQEKILEREENDHNSRSQGRAQIHSGAYPQGLAAE